MGIFIVIVCAIAILALVCIGVGIAEYRKHPKPPKGMTYDELCEYYYTHGWEPKKSVMEYLEAGQKTQAIKELQTQTGCSLSDAVEAIGQLEASLKRRKSSEI